MAAAAGRGPPSETAIAADARPSPAPADAAAASAAATSAGRRPGTAAGPRSGRRLAADLGEGEAAAVVVGHHVAAEDDRVELHRVQLLLPCVSPPMACAASSSVSWRHGSPYIHQATE